MNSPEALAAVDRIRKDAECASSTEELRALVVESTELIETAVQAIMSFQVAEQLVFEATGIRVPDEIVALALEQILLKAEEESASSDN